MLDKKARIDNFILWLSDSGRKGHFSSEVCISCIEKVSDYALRKRISKVSLWEIDSVREFNQIRNSIAGNKLFRITEKPVGVILRRDCQINDYDEILALAVAKSGIRLTKDEMVNYLAGKGYISTRRMTNINEIINKAKLIRAAKGQR